VPAAAVTPAPIAYIKVVVVKKLYVELWAWLFGPPHRVHCFGWAPSLREAACPLLGVLGKRDFYCEKIRVL
jgi:hypothetical protein